MPAGEDDDDLLFPSPRQRSWVHPAEASSLLAPAPSAPAGRRPSAGMLVAAASVGALAMFGALAATGMISGFDGDGEQAAVVRTAATPRPAVDTGPTSVVSVRVDGAAEVHRAAGLVLDRSGNIVTSAAGMDLSSPVTVDAGGQAWKDAVVVGIDPSTHLAVIRVEHPESLEPAAAAEPAMGPVRLVTAHRPASERAAQLANTNETVSMGAMTLLGAVVISTDGPPQDGVVVLDATGAAVALPSAVDDDESDRLMFAVPAQTALRVGRDLVEHRRVTQVTLGVEVTDGADHGVQVASVVAGGPAESAGVNAADHLSAIDTCPTPDADRLSGCLMRYGDRSVVTLTLRRGSTAMTLDATLRDIAGV